MSDNPGFLETLREQQMTQGPEFDPIPVDPTHPQYEGVSGNLAWQQSQEESAKANIPFSEDVNLDIQNQHYYDDSITMFAMDAVNNIKGLEFESYEDWEAHVDRIIHKIKSNRS